MLGVLLYGHISFCLRTKEWAIFTSGETRQATPGTQSYHKFNIAWNIAHKCFCLCPRPGQLCRSSVCQPCHGMFALPSDLHLESVPTASAISAPGRIRQETPGTQRDAKFNRV